jgi:hypothetical protein
LVYMEFDVRCGSSIFRSFIAIVIRILDQFENETCLAPIEIFGETIEELEGKL